MLLTMEHFDEIYAGFRVCHPLSGMPHHDGHGRKSCQAFLIDEFQFARVGRIEAQAKAQGINNRVPFGIALYDILEGPVQNLFIIQ